MLRHGLEEVEIKDIESEGGSLGDSDLLDQGIDQNANGDGAHSLEQELEAAHYVLSHHFIRVVFNQGEDQGFVDDGSEGVPVGGML